MSSVASRQFNMPYLQAIQEVPGDTPSQKLSWIKKLISPTQVPLQLLPILRIEEAIKNKMHMDIVLALKSEDSTIVSRALKASWFFDGSHQNIVNITYFREHIFPYVSIKTRIRIINTLAHRLTGKDPVFAREMFMALSSDYNIQTACSLLLACDEDYVYQTIVIEKFVLPLGILKKIFRKNPNLAIKFLKLLKPYNLRFSERHPFVININKYVFLLRKLIKKQLECFIELFERHYQHQNPNFVLSNTCADVLLRKGRKYVIANPQLYIKILPLKKIDAKLMEIIFPDLFPDYFHHFIPDTILKYLKYYPQDKKYELLCKSYEKKYSKNFLERKENVTVAVLRLLPAEERIEQAIIKIEHNKILADLNSANPLNFEEAWVCYLPIYKAIPIINQKLKKASSHIDRAGYICQLIYTSKVNENDDVLSDTLMYIIKKHKNEEYWFFEQMFFHFMNIYDISHLNEKNCTLLHDIIKLVYIKYEYIEMNMIEKLLHCRLKHNMPITQIICMCIEINDNRHCIEFNMLKEHPQYERQCLVTFAYFIQSKYASSSFCQPGEQQEEKDEEKKNKIKCTLCRFVKAMYDFNNRCEKLRENEKMEIECMTIKDYHWLRDAIYTIILSQKENIPWKQVRDILKTKETALYYDWFPSEQLTQITDVRSGAALALLKKNPEIILNNWEKYLIDCKENYKNINVQRFVRVTRWYKDIPIKFAKRSKEHLDEKIKNTDSTEIESVLVILSILLHGETLRKLIDPLIPKELKMDTNDPNVKEKYKIVRALPLSIKLSNPPVPLNFVVKLCQEDHLSIGLRILTNICRRSSLSKVMSLARNLTGKRVSLRKHGIRLMRSVASTDECVEFFKDLFAIENHHSIREVLFKEIQKLFIAKPCPTTWSIYSNIILSANDTELFSKITELPNIPNEYIKAYLKLYLVVIDKNHNNKNLVFNFLGTLTEPVCNLLSEEFMENIFKRFLFLDDIGIGGSARKFAKIYLSPKNEKKLLTRIKVFIDILNEIIRKSWDEPHPCIPNYYPVRSNMHQLIQEFSYTDSDQKLINPLVIDSLLVIFSSILSPVQDAKSYLLLVYAKKLQECKLDAKSFGLELGRYMPELINIFSPLLVSCMAEVLEFFVKAAFTSCDRNVLSDIKKYISESLIEAGNEYSCFMAVTLSPKFCERNELLSTKLQEMNSPAIMSVLYAQKNMSSYF